KVCDGLAYAHSCGVLHRDLKPDNIMVGEFGEVQVMDWGLARLVDEPGADDAPAAPGIAGARSTRGKASRGKAASHLKLDEPDDGSGRTMDGEVMGTPQYMSPEQAMGKISELDERTDVYALGAILHEMLALAPAFAPESVLLILDKVTEGDFVPAHEQVAHDKELRGRYSVREELSAIALRAMALNPRDRYPSALDLRHDIDRYMDGQLVGAAHYSLLGRFRKFAARNRAAVIAAAIILVLGISGAIGAAMWADKAQREAVEELLVAPRATLQAARKAADDIRSLHDGGSYEEAVTLAQRFAANHAQPLADMQRLDHVRTTHPEWLEECAALPAGIQALRDDSLRKWAAETLKRLPPWNEPRAARAEATARAGFERFGQLAAGTGVADVPFAEFATWLAAMEDFQRSSLVAMQAELDDTDPQWQTLATQVEQAAQRTTQWVVRAVLAQPDSPAVADALLLLAERALHESTPYEGPRLALRFHQVLGVAGASSASRTRAWLGLAESLLMMQPTDMAPFVGGETTPAHLMALRCLLQVLAPDGMWRDTAGVASEAVQRRAQHMLMIARRTAAYAPISDLPTPQEMQSPPGRPDEVWWPDEERNVIRRVLVTRPSEASTAPPSLSPISDVPMDALLRQIGKPDGKIIGITFCRSTLRGAPKIALSMRNVGRVLLSDLDPSGRVSVIDTHEGYAFEHSWTVADLDGDGVADEAWNGGNAAWARFGNGDGTFGPDVFVNPEFMRGPDGRRDAIEGVATGDLDGDGVDDMIVSRSVWNSFHMEVWMFGKGRRTPRMVCKHTIGDSRVTTWKQADGSVIVGASPEVQKDIAIRWKAFGTPIRRGMHLMVLRNNEIVELPVPAVAMDDHAVKKGWSGLSGLCPLDDGAALVLDRPWHTHFGRCLVWDGPMKELRNADVITLHTAFRLLGTSRTDSADIFAHLYAGESFEKDPRHGISRRLTDADIALIATQPAPAAAAPPAGGIPEVRFARLLMELREYSGVVQLLEESLPRVADPALQAELYRLGLHALDESERYGDLLALAERMPPDPGLADLALWAANTHIQRTGGHLQRIEALLARWADNFRVPAAQQLALQARLDQVRAVRKLIASEPLGFAGPTLLDGADRAGGDGGDDGATLGKAWIGDAGYFVPDGTQQPGEPLVMIDDGCAYVVPDARDAALPAQVVGPDGQVRIERQNSCTGMAMRVGDGDVRIVAELDMPGCEFGHMPRFGLHRLMPPGGTRAFYGVSFNCGGQASVFNVGWAGAPLSNLIGHRLRFVHDRLASLGVIRETLFDAETGKMITRNTAPYTGGGGGGGVYVLGVLGSQGGYFGSTWGQVRLHRLTVRGNCKLLTRDDPDVVALLTGMPTLAALSRAIGSALDGDRATASAGVLAVAQTFDDEAARLEPGDAQQQLVRYARRLRLDAALIASNGSPDAFAQFVQDGRAGTLDENDLITWIVRKPYRATTWAGLGLVVAARYFGGAPPAEALSRLTRIDPGGPAVFACSIAAAARHQLPQRPDLRQAERQVVGTAVARCNGTIAMSALSEYLCALPPGPEPAADAWARNPEYVGRILALTNRVQRADLVKLVPEAQDAAASQAFNDPGFVAMHRALWGTGQQNIARATARCESAGILDDK
ncbi:MAG: protein kinase, partial [Planctomycetota bacterium]